MEQFERNLREVLRRREPPAGFETKVFARAREMDQRNGILRFWPWSWQWTAAAMLSILILGSAPIYRWRQNQIDAEKSKQELMLALRVTGSKLRLVQERLSGMEQKTVLLPVRE